MTQYLYQTNTSLLLEGELGLNGSNQLVTKDNNGNLVVLTPAAGATAVSDLVKQYAADAMDLSGVRTLGTGFIFLNGTSFDSMGVGVTEFEESNGVVYGLYGRTDGVAQQVYYSAAFDNTQAMQYTTVPYVPPFLNGNVWQAQCICGQDAQGFTVQLRDTTSGSTATPRYLYVQHNGSLLNSSGHTYVEITQAVNTYLSSVTYTTGGVPNIIRVGQYFFIGLADWQNGSLWIGGWNDNALALTSASLPASTNTYTPTRFTVTTSGLQGGDITTASYFPSIMGSNTPGGVTGLWRIYNQTTGAVTTPTFYNCPEPLIAGWTTNLGMLLEGEADDSGNAYIAVGTSCAPGDASSTSGFDLTVFSIAIQFTAGSAGAYTASQFNVANSNTAGVSLNYMQPFGTPYLMSANPGTGRTQPAESQASNVSVPSTCANKLPIASFYTGQPSWGSRSPVISWYYSGVTALSTSGSSGIVRGVTRPSGAQFGSREAARANKLAMLYPMFNVNQRADFDYISGAPMNASLVQPSGKKILSYNSFMVSQDLILSAAVDPHFNQQWVMSQMPTNSNITDATYIRNGVAIPGFGTRIEEYDVNLPTQTTTLNNYGSCWNSGMANPKSPVSFIFPALASAGLGYTNANNAQVRLGSWTLSGGVYQPPPVVWTYASNMQSQVSALYSSAIAAAQGAYTGFDVGFFVDVVPILNSAGSGLSGLALGLVNARNSANTSLNTAYFLTPCALSGSVISLTNTSSITLLGQQSNATTGVPGTPQGQDQMFGTLFVAYGSSASSNWYIGWSNPTACSVAGDALISQVFVELNSSNGVVSFGAVKSSESRGYLSCSVQHQGIAIMPYRDGDSLPQVDIPIARYSTSATNTQDDLAASFQAAIANPRNLVSGTTTGASNNLAEITVMDAINNNFLLQIGSMSGRINHTQYTLPSTFIDMTSYAVGTYYLYVTYSSGTVSLQVSATQIPESSTSMYFGSFQRTSTGFSNQTSVSEVVRFGTARLVSGTSGQPMQGSQIRIGPYVA
jgi:hypothetical protein